MSVYRKEFCVLRYLLVRQLFLSRSLPENTVHVHELLWIYLRLRYIFALIIIKISAICLSSLSAHCQITRIRTVLITICVRNKLVCRVLFVAFLILEFRPLSEGCLLIGSSLLLSLLDSLFFCSLLIVFFSFFCSVIKLMMLQKEDSLLSKGPANFSIDLSECFFPENLAT